MVIFSALRGLIRYAVAPVFFLLAGVNYLIERSGGGHGAHHGGAAMDPTPMADGAMTAGGAADLPGLLHTPVIASMWLMYLLMGFAHLSPWLPGGRKSTPSQSWE